jgi:hypothetical protein
MPPADRVGERLEARALRLRHVEELGDHADRERVREVGDEVDVGLPGETRHEVVDDGLDARRDRADAGDERRVQERAHGVTVGRVGGDRAEVHRRRRPRAARGARRSAE